MRDMWRQRRRGTTSSASGSAAQCRCGPPHRPLPTQCTPAAPLPISGTAARTPVRAAPGDRRRAWESERRLPLELRQFGVQRRKCLACALGKIERVREQMTASAHQLCDTLRYISSGAGASIHTGIARTVRRAALQVRPLKMGHRSGIPIRMVYKRGNGSTVSISLLSSGLSDGLRRI
ncbi:hypothetical protein FB451DRAFT_1255552 [Mycena latifolia]|nr:hypothetical protein FB451DRAFT_1255552 [Mycena latifolia]